MSDQKQNGVSTPEEFRLAAVAERLKRAQVIILPSGLKAKLVKPSPWESFMHAGTLPQSLAASISPTKNNLPVEYSDAVQMARRTVDLVRFVFVEPQVPDQCRPGLDIPFSDIEFALQWARGEATDSGQNLETFPQERASAPGIPNA